MQKAVQKIKRLRKGRCIIILVFALLLFFLFVQGYNNAAAANTQRTINQVYVMSGDTLWALVQEHYNYDGDIRNAIIEVQRLNNLPNSRIYVGQVLMIPAY